MDTDRQYYMLGEETWNGVIYLWQKGPYAQEMANANFFVLKAIDVKI